MTEKEVLKIIERAAREKWTEFTLNFEDIKSLPVEIVKLRNLKKLEVGGNNLKNIPKELGTLTKLNELNLANNELKSIPKQLGRLTNLKELWIHNNEISNIPKELGQLENLKLLSMDENRLSSLPPEIGNLKKLERLFLQNNRFVSFPKEIESLRSVEAIGIDSRHLVVLLKRIGNFPKLEELYLNDQQLRVIPAVVMRFTRIRQLKMYSNQLASVPAELGNLNNLTALHLSGNQLKSIPKELGKLKNLTYLDLSNNRLKSIPKELGQLTNLTYLDLSDNRLKSIPKELGQLKNLEGINLEGNLLESPPPDVMKGGTKAVLAYLRELGKGKKKRYEAKLLILGDASEGKTCVSRALRGSKFEHQETTEGVDIEEWRFKHPQYKTRKIKLNIWDFEGQEINHQSHQFFLTQRALYLLVFKGREVFNRTRVEYWLDTIRSRAPESEVILVATECETKTPHVPVDELRARYPDLLKYEKCFFELGCATKKGVSALRRHIQKRAAKMEVMGKNWPLSFDKAEKVIEHRKEQKAHINRRNLNSIFKKNGIVKSDYEDAAKLMGYLGIITHFPDCHDLKKFVVLKPQWLTKGISLVMEDEQLKDDKGEITHERLHKLWEEKYRGLPETFHKCMREFELCYDLEYRNRHLSLIPLRFGFDKPKKVPWNKIPNSKERRIEYRFDVTPPAGIMSRFIVKTHYMIVKTKKMPKGVYWYNGVFLGIGEGENRSEALCEFDADKRVMSICVRAAFPQNMVEQLNGFVQSVFSFFEGLEPERYYGCVKVENEKESQCNGIYTEKRISFALTQRSKLDCECGYHKVNPLYLITGITSFGEWEGLEDRLRLILRREMDKEPQWAKKFGKNIRSILVRVDSIAIETGLIKKQGEKLPAEIEQKFKLAWRDYWHMLDEMLDNRAFNSAPAVVSIASVDGSRFNPKNWFQKEYVLTTYCEYEGGVHKVDFSVKFKKSREWWEKTAPKLAFGVKVLSAGIKLACAGLPLGVDAKLFDAMKNEVEFMKELAGHLELEGGAESDIGTEAGEFVEKMKGGKRLRDLRQVGGEDEKRIVRMQLAELFKQIAPMNYKARKWGQLRRVRLADNTYR